MLSRTIKKEYKDHERSFEKTLKKAKTLEEKPVHELRLSVKAIFILLGLMAILSKKRLRHKAIRKLLRPAFKSAGKLRTTMLNLKLIQPYRSAVLMKFKKYLKKKQETERHSLLKELKKIPVKKIAVLHKKNLLTIKRGKEELPAENAIEYLREILAGIRAGLFDINNDETLHEVRQQIKTVKNIGQLLGKAGIKHPFNEDLKKISDTYEKIGRWHDTLELVKELEKFVDNLHDPKGLEKTVPLILKLKKENLRNKRQIARKLRADLVRP